MLIGRAPRQASHDLVELLLECHQRIREFAALAVAVAEPEGAPPEQVREDCARVCRYFTEAFPLHVADEERSILPRLMGNSQRVDDALSLMQLQHRTHDAPLAELLSLCTTANGIDRQARLRVVATELQEDFERHLVLEESIVFPAIRSVLSAEMQRKIVEELRARRQATPEG